MLSPGLVGFLIFSLSTLLFGAGFFSALAFSIAAARAIGFVNGEVFFDKKHRRRMSFMSELMAKGALHCEPEHHCSHEPQSQALFQRRSISRTQSSAARCISRTIACPNSRPSRRRSPRRSCAIQLWFAVYWSLLAQSAGSLQIRFRAVAEPLSKPQASFRVQSGSFFYDSLCEPLDNTDSEFAMDAHFAQLAVESEDELTAQLQTLMMAPLDLARPLWHVTIIRNNGPLRCAVPLSHVSTWLHVRKLRRGSVGDRAARAPRDWRRHFARPSVPRPVR